MTMIKCIVISVLLTLFKIETYFSKTAIERIINDGYPAESHHIQTEDGFILEVHRIPGNKSSKGVVLIQHGFIASSESFLCNGAHVSLPYQVYQYGFDVWLGNFRGNTYSRNHSSLKPDSRKFWDYSFHDHGLYDLPAMIDYILKYTKKKSLHFIGHSMGTTALLVLLSENPKYNKKVKSANLLAPVGYISNSISPIVRLGCPLLGSTYFQIPNTFEIFQQGTYLEYLLSHNCQDDSCSLATCRLILSLNSGTSSHTNESLCNNILETNPAGGSSKQFEHYCQWFRKGAPRKFDYGILKNQIFYNRTIPPEYKFEKINVLIYIFYGNADYFVTPVDVKKLLHRLGNKVKRVIYYDEGKFSHNDFMFANNVDTLVNGVVLENILESV
ncbi:LIPA.2 family protein [Megaselia abdita]